MVKNLTEGKPLPLLFFFALPMVAGNLFQQLYNMVDTAVVGQYIGEDAVAAVGASFPIVFLSVAMSSGLSMGSNVVVSQQFGAGQIHRMKGTISTALISLGTIGLLVMALGQLFSEPLLRLLGTDPDILADSLAYLQIYFGGSIFVYLYNALNGIYNALGDSKTPLIFLVCSTILNIGLDILFVVEFGLGVAGVAWATLIAQGLCAVVSFLVMTSRLRTLPLEEGAPTGKPALFRMEAMRRIAVIGLPSMLQQSLVSISALMMQSLANSFGKTYVAGYTAAMRIDTLCLLPNMNIANASSTFTAQNIGAKKTERVEAGFRASVTLSLIFSLTIMAVIFLFGDKILSLFLNQGGEGTAMGYGVEYMRIVSVFYFLMGILFISNSVLRGAGAMQYFVASSFSNLICRVVSAYFLAPRVGSVAIAISIPVGWAVGLVVSQYSYRTKKWKKNIPEATAES